MPRHQENYKLRTWESVFEAFANINIDQGIYDLNNKDIEADLTLIKGYASSKYFLSNNENRLREEIEQVQYFKEDIHYSFIDYIHEVAELIREGERMPNFQKGFKNNIFSNLGWFNQFLITIMLGRMYKVKNVEHNMSSLKTGPKFDCDVEIEFKSRTIHCQIKDIAEHERQDRIHDIKDSIEDGMNYPDGFHQPRRKMSYRVVDFNGSPPKQMPLEKWTALGVSLNMREREFEHIIAENTYGTHEAKVIKFKVHGFRRGSFRYSPEDDFSNMEKLAGTYNSIEERVSNTQHTATDSFLLIANSYDHPDWAKGDLKAIRDSELSVMTVHIWGMSMIDFSSVAMVNSLRDFESDFNSRIKKAWVKII